VRSIAFIIIIFIQKADVKYFWISQIIKSLPSLFFLTSYSFLIHFMATISSIDEISNNLSKPLLLGLNIISYLSFIFIIIYCKSTNVRLKWDDSRVFDCAMRILWYNLLCLLPLCVYFWYKNSTIHNDKEKDGLYNSWHSWRQGLF